VIRTVGSALSSTAPSTSQLLILLPVTSWAVMGCFDGIWLRPEPALYLSLICGAHWQGTGGRSIFRGRKTRVLSWAVAACGCLAVGSGIARLVSLELRERSDLDSLVWAARLDPGDYALHRRAAVVAAGRSRCGLAQSLESRARRLLPAVPIVPAPCR
jgi:hypothetical protein